MLALDSVSLKITKASCDCERVFLQRKCCHIETLKQLASTELRNEIEKVRREMMQIKKISLRGDEPYKSRVISYWSFWRLYTTSTRL